MGGSVSTKVVSISKTTVMGKTKVEGGGESVEGGGSKPVKRRRKN